ncbi:MAG: hypothetical protein HC840_00415 [Leptolyngbyaceae cyanobacterium RM2_2_4]|nr:hypothetical protein [Leptolyngbyaceae cyanobacterium RM2_2_4]
MRKGKVQKIDWRQHDAPKFTLHTKPHEIECGAWALHVITKFPYHYILPLGKDGHCSNKVMFNFLKAAGCEIIPITIGNMVESHSVKSGKRLLSSSHVILVNQGCYKEESTWAVLHDNKISHSGDLSDIGPLEFVNWPILEAFLITHKEWK